MHSRLWPAERSFNGITRWLSLDTGRDNLYFWVDKTTTKNEDFDRIDELVSTRHYSITHSTPGENQDVERPLYLGCAVVRSEV